MNPDDRVRICIDGVVHTMSSDYESITACGISPAASVCDDADGMTLDPVDCVMCLTDDQVEVYFRCECSWVGGDPDWYKGRPTCPACFHHDRKRKIVFAVPNVS